MSQQMKRRNQGFVIVSKKDKLKMVCEDTSQGKDFYDKKGLIELSYLV